MLYLNRRPWTAFRVKLSRLRRHPRVEGRKVINPDPTLIGLRNRHQQPSDGASEMSVPWFDNSPEVSLRTSDPNVYAPYNIWSRTARGLVIFVGSGLMTQQWKMGAGIFQVRR